MSEPSDGRDLPLSALFVQAQTVADKLIDLGGPVVDEDFQKKLSSSILTVGGLRQSCHVNRDR